jgi:hypothetical protein
VNLKNELNLKNRILNLIYFTFISVFFISACGGDEVSPENADDNDQEEEEIEEVVVSAEGFEITILENPVNDFVLNTVVASASDGSALTFTISSESVEGAFSVSSSGEITVADGTLFNFEKSEIVTAEVTATNVEEISETVTVSVSLLDDILERENGLMAYYPLNGDVSDASETPFDGESVGDMVTAPDRFGNENAAMNFSDNRYFWVPNFYEVGTPTTQAFSISLWVKYDGGTPNTYHTILSKVNSSREEISYRRRLIGTQSWQDGSQEVYLNGNPAQGIRNSGNPLPVDEWTHVAMVFDPSTSEEMNIGTISLYENGMMVSSRINVVSEIGNGLIALGNYAAMNAQGTPTGISTSFSGLLDDIAFFDEPLSAEEINKLFELE